MCNEGVWFGNDGGASRCIAGLLFGNDGSAVSCIAGLLVGNDGGNWIGAGTCDPEIGCGKGPDDDSVKELKEEFSCGIETLFAAGNEFRFEICRAPAENDEG